MHELGILYHVVDTLKELKVSENLTEIESITLEVGELSGVLPKYLEECWPAAVYKTEYSDVELIIEEVEGVVNCNACHRNYNLMKANGRCPHCDEEKSTLVCGDEFNIKEVCAMQTSF